MYSEFSLIKKIQSKLKSNSSNVIIGIGDDCALVQRPKGNVILTVDCLVEKVHFDLKYFEPEDVGHKALAVNLSDIAAMGGTPLYALVSLGIRPGIGENFILGFYKGLSKLAKKYNVQVVGGNITRSKQFFSDITVLGESFKPLLRSTAKVGDIVAISGTLGESALGLKYLRSGKKHKSIYKQLRPEPKLHLGQKLSKTKGVHACIDISDGLSSELWHISRASKVRIQIEQESLDFHSGEDYELLVFLEGSALKSLNKELTVIGRVIGKGTGVYSFKQGKRVKVTPKGWDHLSTVQLTKG